ncbi:Tat pathway signal protein [Microbispora rosea subsp. aerata]|nr:Tat pathway signal protein [Microbispora rosea]GGO07846.1 Tat pathway signal protein [Microbispora rosea subsp. aerata]GIH53278.1 Tat pathway signal protein [Microbispora rosea subsp. aerata]GLJ83808.1 Tat pathway signal protein [Microbispora rosea subsp. aerata]
MARERNERLAALLKEAGWSRAQAASAFTRVAQENGLLDYAHIGRSHISMWVAGTKPSGAAPVILCQALSRRLKRVVTPDELGFAVPTAPAQEALEWRVDPLIALTDLGRTDLDADRRSLLTGAVYSVAALALPSREWWETMAGGSPAPAPVKHQRVGRGDVVTVQELTAAFSRIDQRRGGGHGRKALVQYLQSDVAGFLRGTFTDEQVRRDMFSAAGELAYLAGWTAFDNSEHAVAQRYFIQAVKLAARAGNPPLAGHVLRAMAHQAIDLGFARQGLDLSTASMEGQRYASATPRERALLGVVHARALAANGRKQEAARALLKAEDDLASASDGIEEPHRTFFFSEASLAHETACTLRDCGDRKGAIEQFKRSVRTRGAAFRRTHAMTLGYLGATQIAEGSVEEACATWSSVLDTMQEGIHSGRARQTVVDMRNLLSPYRRRRIPAIAELDARAAAYLAHVD